MNRILLVAMLLCSMGGKGVAKTMYKLQLRIPGAGSQMVYLAHYYGKPLPNIYKRDSARLDAKGQGTLTTTDSTFVGGIYMILLQDRKTYFEFLLNKGDDMTVTADVSKMPVDVKVKNSPENDRFRDYTSFLEGYGKKQEEIKKAYKEAKNAADSAAVRTQAVTAGRELTEYRKNYRTKYPHTLLANIFGALDMPKVPEGDHFLADGVTKDSTFAYNYYKSHYWDGFDFQDDRLIYTPVYEARLKEYFERLVVPWTDSVEHEADMLLKKAKGTTDMFKYTLFWITKYVEDSKVMGMDEVFVYLVENYYMKGDAFWLKPEELGKYIDRAQKIAPNVVGNLAPEIRLPNVITKKKEESMLLDIKAPYTLIIFYSPTCGHCQTEIPAVDSAYEAVLKAKGVKVYTVATEGDEKSITDFLAKNKLDKKWTNTWDPERTSDYHNKYDVYSTPTIYLLDEKKIIRGKRLDHRNIAEVIAMEERKLRDKNKK